MKRNISQNWAYDLHKKPTLYGEIYDVDVINQSIEMIIATSRGERLFMPSFGSGLQNRIFNIFSASEAESLLDEVIEDIRRWEDRIIVLFNEAKIIANPDEHYIILIIPYMVKQNGIKSTFQKKVYG